MCPCLMNQLKMYLEPNKIVQDQMNTYMPGLIIHEDGKLENYKPTPEEMECILGKDNKGRHFIFGFMYNHHTAVPEVFITTDCSCTVTVNVSAPVFDPNFFQTFTLFRHQVFKVTLNRNFQGGPGTVLNNKGIDIISDEEIAVFAVNKAEFTTDAFAAFPLDTLDITSASECDETDDEVFSDACSDIDTNSIDTDVITQSKRSKSKIGFSNAKLPSFTGKEKWEVWINRFEAVANLQNWDNKTKLSELLTRLQGEAGDFVFDQLNSKTLKNYSKLATELTNRFGVFENKRTYKVQFNRRTQKPNEDTADYAAELKRIYDKAYSNRHAKIRQEDLLQRFLMGLSDNEARIHIELTKDPKTIEEAVQEVITYRETTSETKEGNSRKNTKVRQLKKQNNQSSQKSDQTAEKKQKTNFNKQGSTNTETDVITVTKDELQKMFDKMYEDKKRNDETQTSVTGHKHHDERQFDKQPFNVNAPSYVPNGNYRKNNSDRNNNPKNIPKCYYCGQPGHYARKCYSNPNRQTDYRNNKATPPRQMNKPYTPSNSNSSMSQSEIKSDGYTLN
ncbi:unnamed protein product [Mytilus coruscus]|uniref:CCHC-type domain-containing protein n=1 Tax=Mytilus coruscus TaxID=42192 RepID=A0A6J8CLC4_MYTCO|nr:unnamed protein product [Mytilus coruscus]